MSTQSQLTVTGFVGSSVHYFPGENGSVPYTSFRLGSTPRVRDRVTREWKDGPTQWYTVKVWRNVARNVAESFRKGEPVVVTGRLSTDEWAGPEGPRTSLVIEATALGHDLVFGATRFVRITSSSAEHDEPDDDSAPADVSGLVELAEPDEDDANADAGAEGAGDGADGDGADGDAGGAGLAAFERLAGLQRLDETALVG